MKHRVQFISLEEDDKDLIVSFGIEDAAMGVKSLILFRTLFYEELLPDDERGVNVSLEGDHYEQEDFNMLKTITMVHEEISISSTFRDYRLDISDIAEQDMRDMITLLKKQNYDDRFVIDFASGRH